MKIWIENDEDNIASMTENYENPFEIVLEYGNFLKKWHKHFVKNPEEEEKFKQKGYNLIRH